MIQRTSADATVRGDSAAADVLGVLLHQSGAGVSRFPDHDRAAWARHGDTDVEVDWAGPLHGDQVVDEASAQAVCGVMHVHGRSTGVPAGLGLDYCGTAAGVVAATGLKAAALGGFRHVTTSVAQVALLTVSQYLAAATGEEAAETGPGGPPFRSADGVLFELETLDPLVWRDFWRDLDVPGPVAGTSWRPFQFRYATATAPLPYALHRACADRLFATLADHARATGMDICPLHDPAPPTGPAINMSTMDTEAKTSPPGDLPLSGVVVLEAGRRVQAPLAAHLLRLLGARVTRIEPPGGDPLRGMPPTCGDTSARWLALNRGKDAEEVDIKTEAGRRHLRELTAAADVFLHNWAPGKAEELALGATDLVRVNPSLVHVHTSGWAGRLENPPLGTDFMAQARTGLGALLRPADEAPAPSLMTLLDVLGGLLGAYAAVSGLLLRRDTGRAVRAESSLLAASDLLRHNATTRPEPGFRRPRRTDRGWFHEGVPVTDDLAALPDDPRFADAVRRDHDHCPEVLTPWGFR
ncbi:CoA transferase [Actinosynnema sp. NPDC020468]|uniref:CoA transferase n=1 Tax=Actinosynnema sp. NPDC020468 TaxID=3154488 RepID=UPI0033D3E432